MQCKICVVKGASVSLIQRSLERSETEKSPYRNSVTGEAGEETTYECHLRQKSAQSQCCLCVSKVAVAKPELQGFASVAKG